MFASFAAMVWVFSLLAGQPATGQAESSGQDAEFVMPLFTPRTHEDLVELHATLFLGAPDQFFKLPNVPEARQRNLDTTVAELHRGVAVVYAGSAYAEERRKMHLAIDVAYDHFKAGRVHEGRMACHKIEDLLWETIPSKPPKDPLDEGNT